MPLEHSYTLSLFQATGSVCEGHFQLSSGRHSGLYVQCATALSEPKLAQFFGTTLAMLLSPIAGITKIVSPAMGGIIIGQEVARVLNVPHVFVERVEGEFKLRRDFTVDGSKVIIVEDVITTGKSSREAADVATAHGATVLGFASIINRTRPNVFAAGMHHKYVLDLSHVGQSWEPEECPLCWAGKPLVKPGSRPTP